MNAAEHSAEEIVYQQLAATPSACITCSFQAEDMVVLDLARKTRPDIPVLFLETGYHFAETYAYRDRFAAEWNLKLVNLMPATTLEHHESVFGKLHQSNPAQCCQIRKVEPLFRGLSAYNLWLTGLRREQSPTRANLQKIETHVLPDGRGITKVSPLADWTNKDVWAYLKANGIDPLPLYNQGYTSIGCEPCTKLPLDPNDARSGRWAGAGKLECGIHTFSEKK
ncbi:MAG TPA: phosphoadenylyl-sulfate reductase [Bryobacteraceae bacterium]|nr:phosphoadenylyl-sulfate reductase [Bryobacteraceae bacterium]